MSTSDRDVATVLAKALTDEYGDEEWSELGSLRRITAVLEAEVIRPREAEARARELEDAAGEVGAQLANEIGSGHTSTYSVRRWLQARAADLRNGGGR